LTHPLSIGLETGQSKTLLNSLVAGFAVFF